MSIDKNEVIRIKGEIESSYKGGAKMVRIRTDAYEQIAKHCKENDISIVKFVNVAALEKLLES